MAEHERTIAATDMARDLWRATGRAAHLFDGTVRKNGLDAVWEFLLAQVQENTPENDR